MEGLIEIAMKKLGEGKKETADKKTSLTEKAAKLAMDAIEKKDAKAFEKALDSFWRIKRASHEEQED